MNDQAPIPAEPDAISIPLPDVALKIATLRGGLVGKSFAVKMVANPSATNNGFILDQFKNGKLYEPEVTLPLLRILKAGDTFVDVGANIGYYSLIASQIVGPSGRVLAFEPGENVLPWFNINLQQSDCRENITVIERPASDVPGREIRFWLNQDGPGGNALYDPGVLDVNLQSRLNPTWRTMTSTTVDAEISRIGGPVNVIKIDVEGAEQTVLEGCRRTICDHDPDAIFAELHETGLHQMGHSQQSLREFMRSFGRETFFLDLDDILPRWLPAGTQLKISRKDEGLVPVLNLMFARPQTISKYWPEISCVFSRPPTGAA